MMNQREQMNFVEGSSRDGDGDVDMANEEKEDNDNDVEGGN